MILGKYKKIKKLGRGAYGEVVQVEDQKGKHLAIKMINLEELKKEPYLEEYLDQEIACMKDLEHENVMKLLEVEEDESFKYLVCEFCNRGDLLNEQIKMPNQVYPVKEATKRLSQVIWGLEYIHKKGYLHRDIKPENILIDQSQNGEKTLKIADFGFSKKDFTCPETVLGTEPFMSPEVFSEDLYSYEVDMWAFGVVFYFMLNREYPFKINNPHAEPELKKKILEKQAKDFSYRKFVSKSSKKIMENCSEEMEELFSRIFEIDGEKRITFIEIRRDPLFREYFPEITHQSKIVYQRKVDSSIRQKCLNQLKSHIVNKENFEKEEAYIKNMCSRYEILLEFEQDVVNQCKLFPRPTFMSYRYLVHKLNVVLIEELVQEELKIEKLKKKCPNYKWDSYCTQKEFKNFIKDYNKNLAEAEKKLAVLYDQCQVDLEEIKKENKFFVSCFEREVKVAEYSDQFEAAFETANMKMYEIVREIYSKKRKSEHLRLLTTITTTHVFWKLVHDSDEKLEQIFSPFFSRSNGKPSLSEFMHWLYICGKEDCKSIIKNELETYLGHQ